MRTMHFNYALQKKHLTSKHKDFFDKLEYFLKNSVIQFSLKSVHICISYSKKETKVPDFMECGVQV